VSAEAFPPDCALIEVHVADLKQLFNSLDPTPFRRRDLDPAAEEFIVSWARELHREAPLGLRVHVDRATAAPDASEMVHVAVREHFARLRQIEQQKLRQLFRVGRTSLVIGLACLAASILVGDLSASMVDDRFSGVLRESLLIGGWVAMWRPIEVFLYDWWPIRAQARLFNRLSEMTVRVAVSRN
jgi:hypothetical protein